MRITILSISLLLLSSGLFAQTQEWRHSDNSNGIYGALDIYIDVNANLYVGGPGRDTLDPYHVPSAAVVIKLDSSGNYYWNQGYITSNSVEYFGMAGDNVGNNYVYGEYYNDTNFNAYITHVDSSGNLDWTAKYNYASRYNAFNNAMVDKDGNILVAGTSDDSALDQEMISVKYPAADSVHLWAATDVQTNSSYNSYFAQTDNAGGEYNLGQAAFKFANNIVLLKYNASGVYQWVKIIYSNIESDEEPASTNADSLGNLYIADNSALNTNYVPFLLKVNTAGNIIWKTLFSDVDNNYNLTSSALDTSYFYVAGSRNSNMFIAKLSASTGDTIWTSVFDTGTINKVILKNGAIYVTGSTGNAFGSSSFFTARISADGYVLWNATYDDAFHATDQAFDLVADNAGYIYVAGQSFELNDSTGSATVIKYHDDQYTCTLAVDSIITVNATNDTSMNGSAIAVVSGGTSSYAYNWSNGGTTDTITGLASGVYCVTVTDTHNCIAISCNGVRPTLLVCLLVIDSVNVMDSPPCYGAANGAIAIYTTGGIGQVSYSVDSGITYQAGNVFSGLSTGVNNYIEVKDTHNCTVLYSANPVTIAQPAADTPAILINGDRLSTGQYTKYNWYVAGNVIDTNQLLVDSVHKFCGDIYVQVVDSNGCTFTSSAVDIICEGILSINDSRIGLTIYPNPFGESFNVKLDGMTGNQVQVQLFDLYGQEVYDDKPSGNNFSIFTSTLAQGVYLLRLQAGGQFLYRQVVKTGN